MRTRKAVASVPGGGDDATRTAIYHTSWGAGWVRFDDRGPVAIGLPGPGAGPVATGTAPTEIAELTTRLERYFRGGRLPPVEFVMLRRAGTTRFLREVYETVARIPRGETATYGEVAAAVKRPGAARGVGSATARNPFAPIIPCHRVVGSDGRLRGYGGGLEMKRALLEMEGSRA